MVKIGEMNTLEVVRKADFGYYLSGGTRNTNDDILLPKNSSLNREINVGEQIEVFVYRDSKDRAIATFKTPTAMVGDIAFLKIVDRTMIGAFADIGLERDVLIPFKEQEDELIVGKSYLVYLYLDKTERIAGTTRIDRFLEYSEDYKIGDFVKGIVYGFQTNGSLMIAVEGKYKGVVLNNEVFNDFKLGDEIELRVKKYYDDDKIGLTPRQGKLFERDNLEEKILEYLKENNGQMIFNDKSSPEEIKKVFSTSKNYFKMALGGLMKKKLIDQDEKGTKLL